MTRKGERVNIEACTNAATSWRFLSALQVNAITSVALPVGKSKDDHGRRHQCRDVPCMTAASSVGIGLLR
jgi:hypothetical protein